MNNKKNIPDTAMTRATLLTMLFVTSITIVAEISSSLKDGLKAMTGHHWVSKGVLSLALFGFLLWVLSVKGTSSEEVRKEVRFTFWFTIILSFILFAFFLWHYIYT
ncbi:MAG: hypothetical protein AABW89_04575 [Nanoarchaeota archaeon]